MLLPLLPQPAADAVAPARRPPPMARVPGFLRFAPAPAQGTAEAVVQVAAADTGLFTDTADTVSLDAAAVAKRRPPPALRAPGLLRFAPAPVQGSGNTVAAADTASSSDTAILATALTAADTGAGADTATLAVDLAAADTGTSVDVATVDMGAGYAPPPRRPPPMAKVPGFLRFAPAPTQGVSGLVQVAAADTGTAADTATLAADLAAADTGTGTDTAALTTAAIGTDTGTSADTATLTAALSATETASAADLATLATAIAAADLAATVDLATVLIIITAPPLVMRPPPMMRGPTFLRFAPAPPQGIPPVLVTVGASATSYPGGPGSASIKTGAPASGPTFVPAALSATAATTGPTSTRTTAGEPSSKGA